MQCGVDACLQQPLLACAHIGVCTYWRFTEQDSCCMQIPGSEKILETVSGADRGNKLANLLKKTGLTKAAMSSFGEPELLDDLADHWNAGNHKEVTHSVKE